MSSRRERQGTFLKIRMRIALDILKQESLVTMTIPMWPQPQVEQTVARQKPLKKSF